MTSTKKLNCALIGLGMVADTHLQAIADLAGAVHLNGVYARTQKKSIAYSSKASERCAYPVRSYTSIDDITADYELDFVIVATPPDARIELTEAFSAANLPILMEKPIERTVAAASKIVELCETRNVMLGIVFQHRMRAASIRLAALLRKNELGTLGLVQVTVPWWRDQAYYNEPGRGSYARDGGGVLISQAIHTLDLMLSLTGEVTEVQALCHTSRFHQMESEDFVSAGLSFKSGAAGSLMATSASYPGNAESIVLHFDKVVADLRRGRLLLNWRDGRTEEFGEQVGTGSGADPMAFTSDWHRDIIANFAASITCRGQPVVPGREALLVHRLIHALVESSRLKRALKVDQA